MDYSRLEKLIKDKTAIPRTEEETLFCNEVKRCTEYLKRRGDYFRLNNFIDSLTGKVRYRRNKQQGRTRKSSKK